MNRFLPLFCALAAACTGGGGMPDGTLENQDATRPDVGDSSLALFDTGPIFVDAGCGATYMRQNEDPGFHVDAGTVITWSTNPPCSGTHFPDWAVWGVHSDRVPRGYYVHNLEHGGIVILYRCDGDCTLVRRQLISFVTSLPPEPSCVGTGVMRRILLTEDPLIDTPVAAAAWGYTYTALCVDIPSLRAFVDARTGHATENLCFDGTYQ